MDISMLPIPKEVKDYDRRYSKMSSGQSRTDLNLSSWHPSQQFGVTLEWILDNQSCTIPPVMEDCINFLQQPDCLETEGIFRQVRTVTWLPGQMTGVVTGRAEHDSWYLSSVT